MFDQLKKELKAFLPDWISFHVKYRFHFCQVYYNNVMLRIQSLIHKIEEVISRQKKKKKKSYHKKMKTY